MSKFIPKKAVDKELQKHAIQKQKDKESIERFCPGNWLFVDTTQGDDKNVLTIETLLKARDIILKK